ncbi:acyltransferase family protein [Mucilaginibacter xinganensis]|uniref:Acyltransferase 3 domain-containing protein n=1 Tax=Mucilaginibacter xinganensis TaxID=1234841 RepID=A0A223NYF9_9SPHI|nr:acyltransferase family protein [Mucilaginibacter xinganensis]ASU34892.1 hypothetical protein MuYL_3007 [Mucilaginibacter xinganensis]
MEKASRLGNIDFLKGVLIILVIAGHVLQGPVQQNFLRYIIYSFHMPVFIGISGYLFNSTKNSNLSILGLINKYWLRIIVPWIIAVIVYALILNPHFGGINKEIHFIEHSFLSPFYHLWFIPGFLSWVLITWVAKKLKISDVYFLIISAIISIVALIFNYYPELYHQTPVNSTIIIILHTFKPYYLVFFVFGNYLKSHHFSFNMAAIKIAAISSLAGIILMFFFNSIILSIVLLFVFNALLLIILTDAAQKNTFPHSDKLEWIGKNSLGIYLWHVLPINILERLLGTGNLPLFYTVTIATELAFLFVMMQITKIKLINKYVFGMV